jgi:DNA-binding CsgD family transcriptional regulator
VKVLETPMKTMPVTYNGPFTTTAVPRTGSADLADIVDAIGSDRFAPRLLAFLHEICGADHCAIFQLGQDSLREIAAESWSGSQEAREQVARYLDQQFWRRDPAIAEAKERARQSEPVIICVDIGRLDADFRAAIYPHVNARIVVCGCREEGTFGLSILSRESQGVFTEAAIDRLAGAANLLISVITKHATIMQRRPNLALALAALPEIERCIGGRIDLPRRETEVCARILYGMSANGIALDLGIGEESVKTYRKRAYERLRIGSERELLKMYLGLWGSFNGDFQGTSS